MIADFLLIGKCFTSKHVAINLFSVAIFKYMVLGTIGCTACDRGLCFKLPCRSLRDLLNFVLVALYS
jgi:hypothetical protein